MTTAQSPDTERRDSILRDDFAVDDVLRMDDGEADATLGDVGAILLEEAGKRALLERGGLPPADYASSQKITAALRAGAAIAEKLRKARRGE